jgi:ribonucleoside-diphosphate reductase alpha chain
VSNLTKYQSKLRFKPVFADPKNHPYKQVDWDDYGWVRGKALRDLIDRVVGKYVDIAKDAKYLATIKDRSIFQRELVWLLLNQALAFDSVVWFTVGKDGPQRVSRQGIIGLDDNVGTKFDCLTDLASLASRGVDVGLNLSKLADGPVGFLKLADGLVGSGAEKMFILDIDHPEIEDFVNCSYEPLGQNTTLGVRLSDDFMRLVESDGEFGLKSRQGGEVVETVQASELFCKIVKARLSNCNFKLQFDNQINAWQTVASSGKITASSPNGEFLALDDLECPRACLNLVKFVTRQHFDFEKFITAVEVAVTALDISIEFGDFSTAELGRRTKQFRPIGLSLANLDGLFDKLNLKPNSKAAQALASAITSLLSAVAYRRSAELAAAVGVGEQLKKDLPNQLKIAQKHYQASMRLTDAVVDELKSSVNINEVIFAANLEWGIALEFGAKHGFRNCQLTLMANEKDFIIDQSLRAERCNPDPINQIELLAAIQPFLTGGISIPINPPNGATVENVAELYKMAWKRRLKGVSFRA